MDSDRDGNNRRGLSYVSSEEKSGRASYGKIDHKQRIIQEKRYYGENESEDFGDGESERNVNDVHLEV